MDDIVQDSDILQDLGVENGETNLGDKADSDAPLMPGGDLDEPIIDADEDNQPKRKKLRKLSRAEVEGDEDNEVAPADEDQQDAPAHKSDASADGEDDEDALGNEPAELPDEGDEKPRKRKRDSGSDEDGDGGYSDDDGDGRPKSKRRKALEKKKKKRAEAELAEGEPHMSKKALQKQKSKEDEEQIKTLMKQEAYEFVKAMDDACDNDIAANKNHQPALSKMKMLTKVQEMLARAKLHDYLMECGVLHACRRWLEPLPDKTLPNVRIRETLLRGLDFLPISEGSLKESRLGRIVMFLLKNDQETVQNKTLAKALIDKWSRPVFELSSNWTDLQYHDESRQIRRLAPRPSQSQQQQSAGDDDILAVGPARVHDENKKKKVTDFLARMPEKSTMEFTIRPVSQLNPEDKGQRQLDGTEILERKFRSTQSSTQGRHTSLGVTKAKRK